MGEWREGTLGEFVTFQRGFDITQKDQSVGNIPVISSGGVKSHHNRAAVEGPGVVIGRKGTLGSVYYADTDYWPHDTTLWVRDFHGNNKKFVYYFMKQLDVSRLDNGTSNPTLNRNHLHPLPINWPSPKVQEEIVGVLGSIDEKIAINKSLCGGIIELGDALYAQSVKDAPVYVALGEIARFHNNRRRPLSAPERSAMSGYVPYYGATGIVDWVEKPLFDEVLVLVGEDGSVIDSQGHPLTQYIWGPAWINNHAHPLSGEKHSTECLYFALRASDVTHLVTGAVQAKISMKNLKSHLVAIPRSGLLKALEVTLAELMIYYRSLSDETAYLDHLQKCLLPRLMDGTLNVRAAEDLISDAL